MTLSRRRFLEVGSIVAASSAVVVPMHAMGIADTTSNADPGASGGSSFHHLSAEQFLKLVGSSFSVDANLGRPLVMELVKVEVFPLPSKQHVTGESFALNFKLTPGSHLPQGPYLF